MTPTYKGTVLKNVAATLKPQHFVQPPRLSFTPHKICHYTTQTLTFLGFRLDSLSMTVSLTGEKILKTVEACKRLQNMTKPRISEVAEVIGLLVSNFPAVQFGSLHYRFLERDKTKSLKTHKGDYKSHMTLTSSSVADLTWWIETCHIHLVTFSIQPLS